VLAFTPLFLDARFRDHVTPPVLDLVSRLTDKVRERAKTELAAVKTELREDLARLDKKIDRVAAALVNTH